MPRYNDRHGNDCHGSTRLYVGRLSSRTRSRDLQDLFSRYGRVRDVDMKHDFAFVDFSDPRDADDAMYNLNGRDFDGSRIIVEFAKGGPRGSGGSREYLGRGPPPGSGRCFNCGLDGHWARDCKAGDWKNKCYRCGERGHIERNCQNSPKSTKHGRSYSRSVSRSPSRRGRNRSRSISRSRSYSRSRSPVHKRERSVERVEKRSRSPAYSRSPERRGSPPHRGRKRSPSPERSRSPRQRASSPPPMERQGSDYSQSPRMEKNSRSPRMEKNSRSPRMEMNSRSPQMEKNSSSPVSQDGGSPPPNRQYSPETNGQNGRSPSPREDNVDEGASPMGSESPRD